MTQDTHNPTSGGSFVRDPKTGALTRAEEIAKPVAPSHPVAAAAPAKTIERKNAPAKNAPEASAVETKE